MVSVESEGAPPIHDCMTGCDVGMLVCTMYVYVSVYVFCVVLSDPKIPKFHFNFCAACRPG